MPLVPSANKMSTGVKFGVPNANEVSIGVRSQLLLPKKTKRSDKLRVFLLVYTCSFTYVYYISSMFLE